LDSTSVLGDSLEELAPKVSRLSLSSTKIHDGVLKKLARFSGSELSLANCNITDKGAIQLFSDLKWLSRVDLSGTKITDKTIQHLIAMPRKYASLRRLDLKDTRVSAKAAQMLREKLNEGYSKIWCVIEH